MAHRGKQKPKQKKRDKLDSRVRAIASQIVSEIQERMDPWARGHQVIAL